MNKVELSSIKCLRYYFKHFCFSPLLVYLQLLLFSKDRKTLLSWQVAVARLVGLGDPVKTPIKAETNVQFDLLQTQIIKPQQFYKIWSVDGFGKAIDNLQNITPK
ncbi:hypothetical protein VB776_15880 [Arcicella sp. DC2W]|uniref:Uncharacterized protein n=1 Tax=Arcicella gelida TaxID=2984195 RepID=A0ABU5S7F6_9BACT|nr:hypothetical protein [Arcicella sp. DC2W]MEA5404413.1 hypothetical protein [Arcicella sp. DC2W]